MGILGRIFGQNNDERERQEYERQRQGGYRQGGGYGRPQPGQLSDEQAIARYRYMLQTAPPETIEQAHAEAFAKLTPEQRQMVLQGLGQESPEAVRVSPNDPNGMARLATRAEINRPGTMERIFGNTGGAGRGGMMGGMMGGGMGMGGMIAGSLLGSVAGTFIGSAIAHEFFDNDPGYAENFGAEDGAFQSGEGMGGDANDVGMMSEDAGGFEDTGDMGGDFDMGGGDFSA